MTTHLHDSGYKKLFSNRTILRQLLETFVAEPWVKLLDFDNCQTIDKSFISDHYKETESDLIYRFGLSGRDLYLYLLLEFQSTIVPFMSVRVLNYLTNFYLDYLASHKGAKRLPAVIPIVLYNGKRKWTAKTEIKELIEQAIIPDDYLPHFKYLLIDESRYDQQQLLKIRNIISTLFLAETHYDLALLESELLNLYDQENDKAAVSLLLNWFKQLALHGRVSPKDYDQLDHIYRSKEEVQTMLVATLQQEKQNIFQAGRTEGQKETIHHLAQLRFLLTEQENKTISQYLAYVTAPEQLANTTAYLLQAANAADFIAFLGRLTGQNRSN